MNAAEFRALRETAGLTRAETARALATTWQTVWRYEEGKIRRIPSSVADTLRQLAQEKSPRPNTR